MEIGEYGQLIFSSGRKVEVNQGIVGLSPELEVYEGYDTGFDFDNSLTIEDVRELADHMIERWTKFKDGLTPEWAEQHLD